MATNYHIPEDIDFPPEHKLNKSRLGYFGAGVLVLAILGTSITTEKDTGGEANILPETSLESKNSDPISDGFSTKHSGNAIVDRNQTEE